MRSHYTLRPQHTCQCHCLSPSGPPAPPPRSRCCIGRAHRACATSPPAGPVSNPGGRCCRSRPAAWPRRDDPTARGWSARPGALNRAAAPPSRAAAPLWTGLHACHRRRGGRASHLTGSGGRPADLGTGDLHDKIFGRYSNLGEPHGPKADHPNRLAVGGRAAANRIIRSAHLPEIEREVSIRPQIARFEVE